MAHADLTKLNVANVERACRAVETLLLVLGNDGRIQQAYRDWQTRHDLTNTRLARLRAAVPTPERDDDQRIFEAAREHVDPRDRQALEALLGAMQVPAPWVRWLTPLVLEMFRALAKSQVTGNLHIVRAAPDATKVSTLPSGHRARHGGADIDRDVLWWYRATIKTPPDTIYALGKEWAAAQHRHTLADSVVHAGIKRAKALLDLLTVIEPTAQVSSNRVH